MKRTWIFYCWIALAPAMMWAQQEQPPAEAPAEQPAAQPVEAPQPQQGTAAADSAAQADAGAQPAEPAAAPTPQVSTGSLNLQNASLVQVIDALCRQLGINYILDPRVEGSVTLNTYGEVQNIDTRSLLDLILRINGAAMVQYGDVYRIVPLSDAARMPISPQVNATDFPVDDQLMLNLVFLKYVNVGELSTLIEPFLGEGASTWAYAPANLLLVLDSRRNMRRLMDLVSLFDSDTMMGERVRVFEVQYGRPSDIAGELQNILQSISLGESTPIRFLPIDRLKLLIGVAPNPGAFDEVERWLRRLDQEQEVSSGGVENYVYRVRYGRADLLAQAISRLYGGSGGDYSGGYGLFSGAASGLGNRYSNAYGGGYPQQGTQLGGGYGTGTGTMAQQTAVGAEPAQTGEENQTGTFLGAAGQAAATGPAGPHVVPNPIDNSLLIQATPQEYRQLLRLIEQLDIPPRQVLIDAKIYEITLTGQLKAGLQAYLQARGSSGSTSLGTRQLAGSSLAEGVTLTMGALVGQARELALVLEANELKTVAKVIAAPSVIATDSIPARINIGSEVPTLTAQAVSPVQSGGNSLFTNSIANRDSGTSLGILAHINPSGVVTMVIDQEVSSPTPTTTSSIQSPSFSKRSVQTQVTVNDGDTIAIGGIIQENSTASSSGIPFLHRVPVLGFVFGGKATTQDRTELVVFLTPRVIYDTLQVTDATEELKSRFQRLNTLWKDQ